MQCVGRHCTKAKTMYVVRCLMDSKCIVAPHESGVDTMAGQLLGDRC